MNRRSPQDEPDTKRFPKRTLWFVVGSALVVVGFIFIPTVAMTAIGVFMVALGGIMLFGALRGK